MIYIGVKEFEDAFSDEVLARSLELGFPKEEGSWTKEEISAIRGDKKISDALGRLVFEKSNQVGSKWGKPEFGKSLGRICTREEISQEIGRLFELARDISGST